MPTTVHYDPALQVWALQTRTDDAGSDIEDSSAAEGRLVWRMYTEGVVGADSYQVTADGADMSVDVGSGTAFTDLAVVAGDAASLGKYGLLLEPASTTLTVPAADLSNPRIDQVYLVVVDDPGTMVKARLGYRQGDAASSPSAPGPDGGWEGSLLLATVAVGAGVTTISQGDITDQRVVAANRTLPADLTAWEADAVGGGGPVSAPTTYGSVSSTVLTIPASWNGWKVFAIASTNYNGSGQTLDLRLVVGGSNGAAVEDITTSTDVRRAPVHSRFVGSATGGVTVALHARGSASGVNLDDISIYARAVRTS